MKKLLGIVIVSIAFLGSYPSHAEPSALLSNSSSHTEPGNKSYEYAIVKWDGPDRLFYNLPNKFELVHLEKIGVSIPKEAQAEEFCLAYASNKMAKDGWEPVNLDSRRIVFRRLTASKAQ